MSKGKKKRKGTPRAAAAPWEALGAGILATLGSTIGQILADGAEHFAAHRVKPSGDTNGASGASSKATAPPPPPRDLAAEILRVLNTEGARSVADLITATGAGLSATIEAVRTMRDVRLVDLENETGAVQLTESGRRAAAALGATDASEQAEEEESEAYPE